MEFIFLLILLFLMVLGIFLSERKAVKSKEIIHEKDEQISALVKGIYSDIEFENEIFESYFNLLACTALLANGPIDNSKRKYIAEIHNREVGKLNHYQFMIDQNKFIVTDRKGGKNGI